MQNYTNYVSSSMILTLGSEKKNKLYINLLFINKHAKK